MKKFQESDLKLITLVFVRTIQLRLKRIMKLGFLLMVGVSMSAYSATKSWKEEVQLHDGRVIVVERYFNLGGYPTLDSRERALLDETITFTLPESNKKISWKTEFRNDLPEPNSLGLLLLDMVGGVPYIATSPAGCIAYNKWKRPNPPYIFFKYDGNDWKRIPLEEFPPELVHANLMSTPDSWMLRSYYTIEQVKEQMQGRNIGVATKTILREPVANAGGSRCGEMVPYGNGGWLGLDWFSDQPTYEACLKFCEIKSVSPQNCPCATLFKVK